MNLKLLGRAGHHGHHNNLFGIDTHLLSPIALGHGAEHLLGRFAGGQVLRHLREIMLAIFDPARGTGRDHGQHTAIFHTLHKFIGFLHNGQIRAEVGVKHLIKAQCAQRSSHFALHIGADGITERFTQASADCRCCLHQHNLFRIGQSVEHLLSIVFLLQCSRRTYGNALAAGDTAGIAQPHLKSRRDRRLKTAIAGADHPDALRFFAHSHTAAAQNTFAVVADHMGR